MVLRVLLAERARFAIESLLLSEKQARRLAPLVQDLVQDTPVFVATESVLEQVIGFDLHRGILAMARPLTSPRLEELLALPGPQTVVLASGLTNHDNIGGVFRNLAAFGASFALLDARCCDPFYRKALRVSVGGVLRVPFVRTGTDVELVRALLAAGYEVLALSPRGAVRLQDLRVGARRALVLGTEGPGLSEEVLALCTSVRLDMHGGFDSLNVATTSGIALYALSS